MKIGIGSNNRTKISACKNAMVKLITAFDAPINNNSVVYLHRAASTSISDMPLQRNEMIKGARERALFIYNTFLNENIKLDYAIGLEGGVYQIPKGNETPLNAFLENWVYIYDGISGFYGSSSSLALPNEIRDNLYIDGRELADVIDHFSGKEDVRSNEGAFGILTNNLINRNSAFENAIINAFIPFFNKRYEI
jgi:inosine/xanthosine triphosphatase